MMLFWQRLRIRTQGRVAKLANKIALEKTRCNVTVRGSKNSSGINWQHGIHRDSRKESQSMNISDLVRCKSARDQLASGVKLNPPR